MNITQIWLKREGTDENADVVVLIKLEGQDEYQEVIREKAKGNFSHCWHTSSGVRERW